MSSSLRMALLGHLSGLSIPSVALLNLFVRKVPCFHLSSTTLCFSPEGQSVSSLPFQSGQAATSMMNKT